MKKDILMRLSEKNNGYLFTAEVLQNGISKTYLAKFVKENEYEKESCYADIPWACHGGVVCTEADNG